MKDIGIELRCRPYHGDSVQIEAVLIKTKSFHYNLVKYALQNINPKMLGKSYQITPKEMRQTFNKRNRAGFDLALLTHNEVVNKYHAIPIKFFPLDSII